MHPKSASYIQSLCGQLAGSISDSQAQADLLGKKVWLLCCRHHHHHHSPGRLVQGRAFTFGERVYVCPWALDSSTLQLCALPLQMLSVRQDPSIRLGLLCTWDSWLWEGRAQHCCLGLWSGIQGRSDYSRDTGA